jgi:hypothetical protein
MKNQRRKGFAQGALCTIIAVLLIGTALAASASKDISVTYNNIKLVVDGTAVTPKDASGNTVEPFIYNGTTYLPVRAVGEALGKDVTWDGDTNTVYLGKAASSTEYSRTNPAPIGTEQTIAISSYSKTYTATVKINSIDRGDAAWSKIKAANQFNSQADSGKEYILVNATITIDSAAADSAVSVYGYSDFDVFTSDNVEYDKALVSDPDPELDGDVYAGGSITGYFTVAVDTDDKAPKAAYGRGYDSSGGIWFALYN